MGRNRESIQSTTTLAINQREEKQTKTRYKNMGRVSPLTTTVYHVSAELNDVIGTPTSTRAGVVKGIWAYIKQNDLQNPDNRRQINCDYKLRCLFGQDQVGMFEMNRLVQCHILERVETPPALIS